MSAAAPKQPASVFNQAAEDRLKELGPFPTVVTPAATSGQARAAMRVRISSS